MNNSAQVIILLGPPGSGKGTQALRIAKELTIPHISTGDLFRENIKNQTKLGLYVKEIIASGKFVSDSIVMEMLFDRTLAADCVHGYVLDGCPRTLLQAEALEKHLKNKMNLFVYLLDVPDEVIVKRVEGRQTCSSCGCIYNRYYSPSNEVDVCNLCKSKLVQRPDDKLEVVQERLSIYHDQTKPLIKHYENLKVLHVVDGSQSPDKVYNEFMQLNRRNG